MTHTKMGDAAIRYMTEHNITRVGWGDAHALHDIFNLAGCKGTLRVPTDAWQFVLKELGRDSRFEKQYFLGHVGARGGSVQKRRLRLFTLKQGAT